MSAAGWFYVQDDKRLGPVGVEHIVHLVVTTALPPSALVWRQGLREWTEADHVPEIAALLPPPLPPGKKPGLHEPPPLPARAGAEKPVEPSGGPPPAPSTPRIDELRRKLEKEPSPRAFGALAEELRKAGDFAESIRVSREGVERSPSYPSLRVTLGRALLEHGELEAARTELEAVLHAVPDNILAERFLGEALEGLGDRAGARRQYLKALALAPGDAQLVARLRALHGGDGPGPAANGPVPSAAEPPSASEPPIDMPQAFAPPPPAMEGDPLAGVLDEHGAESLVADVQPPPVPAFVEEEPRRPVPELPPIPLVAVEDTFEIERANDIAAGTTPKRKSAPEKSAKSGPPKPVPTPVLIDLPADEAPSFVGAASSDVPAVPAAKPAVEAPPAAPLPAKARPTGKIPALAAPVPTVAPVPAAAPAVAPAPAAGAVVPGVPLVPDTPITWPTGRLADHEFADLVREVYSRHWNGLLTLNHMGVEKSVRVQDGRLVFAFSSARDDRLGELLLRRGRITLHQYVEASRAMRKGIRLGTILVEQGALDARELVKVVMDHTQEIIYSAFQWTEGLYHFTDGGGSPEPIMLKLSTPDAILEGIRRIDSWSRIERAVGSMETRYARARGYEKVLSEMTLSLEKLSILTGLDVEQDVGTICKSSTLTHYEVCRTLWAYRVIGVVQRMA
ncbi:MAG TPA: DUF4388 domain-containing protein [Vicinamibacteria bacterium]|nr:DUF4388 domain-containing protein [Vicinamibacteria bacterium]